MSAPTTADERLAIPTGPQDGEPVPARYTWGLVAAWVVVYLSMLAVQGSFSLAMGAIGPGAISPSVAHEFGALTARDVASGQTWRTVTATFVHYSLLHIACNLMALVSFGLVLESWYGGPQFLAVYLVIGAVGNALAVAGRYALGGNLDAPAAGGSSVMFGLIALVAVVGWRSKTRFGDYVRRKMMGQLIVYGVIVGVLARNILDNYGHAGGAIAGAGVGFAHRYLIAWWDRRPAKIVALVLSIAVLGGSAVAQWRAGRTEDRERRAAIAAMQAAMRRELVQARAKALLDYVRGMEQVAVNYERMAQLIQTARGPFRSDPTVPFRHQIVLGLDRIRLAENAGLAISGQGGFPRWKELAILAVKRQPGTEEMREFLQLSRPLLRQARIDARKAAVEAAPPAPASGTARVP